MSMRPCQCGHKWERHPLFTWKGMHMWQCQECLCKKYIEDFHTEPEN